MITLSKNIFNDTKKVHCPFCGGRLCDTDKSTKIALNNYDSLKMGIIIKCHKCGNKINITITN